MAQLPQELIVEILLWLPVKALKRFRSLSKELCRVIDGPDFINSHLSISSQNINHRRKMIFPDRSRKKFSVFDFPGEETLRLGETVSSVWREVCGYCKGLLFLYRFTGYRRKYIFSLWNPSTRQYRDLPDCPFKFFSADVRFYSGLGYDDSTSDYKAILRVHYWSGGTGVDVQVWIYGLKSNTWKRAQDFPYKEHISWGIGDYGSEGFYGIGYFSDGSLHWVRKLFISGVWRKEIVAFDMRKETFSLLPQPAIYLISPPKLHVLEGSLCVSYLFRRVLARVDLFIRKKDAAEKFSWTKLFSLTEPLPSDTCLLYKLKVLGYSKRGDKIMIDLGGKADMVAYDLKEKSFRKVEIDKDASWEAPFLCLETLVSVGIGA